MRGGAGETTLFVLLVVVELAGVFGIYRTLRFDPAPAFSGRSLRSSARGLLAPFSRRDRWAIRFAELRLEHPLLAFVPYLLLFGAIWAPELLVPFGWGRGSLGIGPFATTESSTEFMQTLWQVVAAAVGLSVAMIAFAFQAFMGSAQRHFGGSLREYASETRLLEAVRLGVLALFLDGAVLAGLGSGAPAGWAALWATVISAATLIGVLMIIELTVRSLGREELLAMRRRQLKRVVDAALRRQLLGQAADIILRPENPMAIERSLMFHPPGQRIAARRGGTLRDLWLGPLARMIVSRRRNGEEFKISVLHGLDAEIKKGDHVLVVPENLSRWEGIMLRLAIRIDQRPSLGDQYDLMGQIDRLHGIALDAIRAHQADEWREIGRLYELVLLALPRAAGQLGIPFEGAVAAPGIFGFGPLDRIARHLFVELELAIDLGDQELTEAIVYIPKRVGEQAATLKAHQVADTMLGLYPSMYALSRTDL